MSDAEYTKTYVSIPEQMLDRAKGAEGYSSAAEYLRAMISAGESNIAELDPRTLNGSEASDAGVDTADLDKLILETLDDDYAELDEILENGIQQSISDRLLALAQDDDTPVEKNGFEFRIDE